jgi:enediyne biosynthesis protein E4
MNREWLSLMLIVALDTFGRVSSSVAADTETAWTLKALETRRQEQFAAAKQFKAFYGFQFTNQIDRSQITFHHHIVDDCARYVKATIYDHGTGLAAADVDGDGKIDIFFVNQIGGCQLWRNLGAGKFENITALAGVGLENKICVGASFADLDNDGWPDLLVTTVKMGNVLFKNLGGGKFRDVSKESGLGYVGHSSGAVFFDYDNDGLLDLFVANVGIYTTDERGRGGYYLGVPNMKKVFATPELREPSILYKNLGGLKFKQVSKEMDLQHVGWSGDASFCDLNEDGFPDLYVLDMQDPDKYYENQGGKGFIDKTVSYFPRTPFGAMGIKFFDFNQDGKIDLFVTDMHSDMSKPQSDASKRNFQLDFEKVKSEAWCGADWSPQERSAATSRLIYGNAFYQNAGQGKFVEVSDQIGAETFWPWGLSVGDLNADGYEDAFVTAGMGYPFRYGINSVLLNEAGQRFFDAEFLVNVEPRAGNQVETDYFTLDCSGEDKNHPLCYHQSGIVTVRGMLSSRSSVMADLDDDGDLDIVVAEFNDRPQILISNLSSKKKIHYLKIKLVGTISNRDGLGATVRVKTGEKTYTQYHNGKSGYLSQSSLPLYFGLGEASEVDGIEITWPSGTRQTVKSGLALNRQIEIKEPGR